MRVALTEVVLKAADLAPSNTATARLAQRLEVFVYKRGTEEEAALYSTESGGEALAQPLTTDGSGRPVSEGKTAWVEEGSYDLVSEGVRVPWEASRGDTDLAKASKEEVEAEESRAQAAEATKAPLDEDGEYLDPSVVPPSVVTDNTIFEAADGAAAKPGLTFAGATDIGAFRYGTRLGLVTGGVLRAYVNTDGALIVPDTANGDPIELGSGTAPGSIISGHNRFFRSINFARTGTVRLFGINNSNDLVIGGEGGSAAEAPIVIRATVTEFSRSGSSVLNLKSTEVEAAKLFVAKEGALVNYNTNGSGSTAFLTKVKEATGDQYEIRNNGQVIAKNTAGETRYALSATFIRQTYTQTFATPSHINPARTSVAVGTTAATKAEPYGYTTQAQADAIPVAINAVRADVLALQELVNGIIDDLQGFGWAL